MSLGSWSGFDTKMEARSKSLKARCEVECAKEKVSWSKQIKAYIKAQVDHYRDVILDELYRLQQMIDDTLDGVSDAITAIQNLDMMQVIEFLGIHDIAEDVVAKLMAIINLVDKFTAKCDCEEVTSTATLTNTINGESIIIVTTPIELPPTAESLGVGKEIYDVLNSSSKGLGVAINEGLYAASGATENPIDQTRTLVAESKKWHPAIREAMTQYPIMTEVLGYTGEWIYADNRDKQSLGVDEWATAGNAKCLRSSIEQKMDQDSLRLVQSAYDKTNLKLYDGLSKQYGLEDEDNKIFRSGFVSLGLAHGLQLAGDVRFYMNHASSTTIGGKATRTAVDTVLGVQKIHLNYLYPVLNNITIKNEQTTANVYPVMVVVDKRENMYAESFTTLCDSGLK